MASIKFVIKETAAPAEKEGDQIVRYSGTSEPYKRSSERQSEVVGVDGGGNPKLVFTTGLNEDKVDLYHWFTEDERKKVKKVLKELKPKIEAAYGGADVIEETNRYFWKNRREVNTLKVENADVNIFFDTERPSHALLYLSILAGAFIDLIAPTKDYAERNQIPHYIALETDGDILSDDIEITKMEALSALSQLKEEQPEALFILAWCLQYDTTAFGAYNKSTSIKDLLNYHIKYINDQLTLKGSKKRNFPKSFKEYAEKWKSSQTRPDLYTEAYVKAGEYFSFINQREKKYVTVDGTVLGNTITQAVENLNKPKFTQDFEKLRELVERKWNE